MNDQPYTEALALGDLQNAIMEQTIKIENIETIWVGPEVQNTILELLKHKEN